MKRTNRRYPAKKGASALFKKAPIFGFLKPRIVQKGSIIDFNLTGIGAEYKTSTVWLNDFDMISVVTIDNKFSIENIPCKIISDHIVHRFSDGTFLRRCGLKFGGLSDYHKLQLSNFMKDYSIDQKVKNLGTLNSNDSAGRI